MIKYDLSEFDALVTAGYLRKDTSEDLILYGYSEKCVFEKYWTPITKIARGIIFNREGELVAKPFPKFWNLNEMPETEYKNLPELPYTITTKMDGSLGIIFNYNGEWRIATRGSFCSDQAIMSAKILKKYNLNGVRQNITLLVEIIYPENKIVVNYGKEEKLVLLGFYDRETGHELLVDNLDFQAVLIGMPSAPVQSITIEEAINLSKTLPKDEEGFVVRFENGLRVKIKGDEYLRIAKLISHLGPLSLWESMANGVVNEEYLAQLPEEMRGEYEPLVEQLELQYIEIMHEIKQDSFKLPCNGTDAESRKTIGLALPKLNLKHSAAMFPYVLDNKAALDKYIMNRMRPTANRMRDI